MHVGEMWNSLTCTCEVLTKQALASRTPARLRSASTKTVPCRKRVREAKVRWRRSSSSRGSGGRGDMKTMRVCCGPCTCVTHCNTAAAVWVSGRCGWWLGLQGTYSVIELCQESLYSVIVHPAYNHNVRHIRDNKASPVLRHQPQQSSKSLCLHGDDDEGEEQQADNCEAAHIRVHLHIAIPHSRDTHNSKVCKGRISVSEWLYYTRGGRRRRHVQTAM